MAGIMREFDEIYQILERIDNGKQQTHFDTHLKCGLFLRHILINGPKAGLPFYVSVGEADWVSSFLKRLFAEAEAEAEAETNNDLSPKINQLYVYHLSVECAQKREAGKLKSLSEGFCTRMVSNIKDLERLADLHKIKFQEFIFNDIPTMHGHLYNNWTITGKWVGDKGINHVYTPMIASPSGTAGYNSFKKMLDTAIAKGKK
jgi:hypothetical protein